MARSSNRGIRIPVPGHDVTMTRRAFGAVALGAVFAGIAWAANLASGGTEEEFETLYVDDEEEPECDEYEEHVTTGELAAHIGCAIALSAIDNEDYDQMLKDLGLYGNEPGKYTYSGGNIWLHLHDNADWRASQPYYQAGRTDNKRGDIFTFGLDEMPNRALPKADVYIDWKMGKGLRPEYGQYVAPEELGLHPVSDRWAPADEYVEIVERNKKAIDQYGTFAQCGAVPVHIHQAMGLEPYDSGLWHYFSRTMTSGGSQPMSQALPEPTECGNYWIYPYDASVAFDDFCEPGDMLVWAHDAEPVATHFALYVGNDIAKRYFPNTTGNVCEAGAGGRFCGITRYGVTPWGSDWLFVCRPKDIAVNMRQDLPPLKLQRGCDNPCENLTLGERIAHTACAISISAVGEGDYNVMLRQLGIYGTEPRQFDWSGGHIHNHVMRNEKWKAEQVAAGYEVSPWETHWSFACELPDCAPDPRIPHAQDYIDFTMAKGVDPKYGTYLPEPICRNPEYREIVKQNKKNISSYSQFTMCGAVPTHVHWAHGLDVTHAYKCYGGIYADRGGNTPMGGVTTIGVPWASYGPPGYVVYFPDHIYGKGAPLEWGDYQCWSVDPEKRWVDQCEPGDMLTIEHAYWGDNDPADYKQETHLMLYVGNDIVREYFPNSNGIIVEAGGTLESYCGVVGDVEDMAHAGFKILRPKDSSDLEVRQWIPKVKGC